MPASRSNLLQCELCHGLLSGTLGLNHRLHFCSPECCHEWSSMQLSQSQPSEVYEMIERLRLFLLAKLTGQGEEAAFIHMLYVAVKVFPAVVSAAEAYKHPAVAEASEQAIAASPQTCEMFDRAEYEKPLDEEDASG